MATRKPTRPLSVHVLVDLEWSEQAGGHVKCWEQFAKAAALRRDVHLTIHFSGTQESLRTLAPTVQMEVHLPVFSTRRIPFLGHVPDHTDMAPYHARLARSLEGADVIHTTDAFFAFTRTAESYAKKYRVPLVHSVHTDTVSYTELFTRSMIEKRFGQNKFSQFLTEKLDIPARAARSMRGRLYRHMNKCVKTLISREEDKRYAEAATGKDRVGWLRLGMDKALFNPEKAHREDVEKAYGIPRGSFLVVFAGRLDEGKNIYVLIEACERLVRDNVPVFLLAAGVGPAEAVIKQRLKGRSATPGFLTPAQLAEAYASADYLALPSQVETWSLAAAEALSCGCPVIAAAESGVGRFISSHHAGMTVKENTGTAWARALKEAYAHRADVSLRHAAVDTAGTHFPSWQEAFDEDLLPVWLEAGGRL